MNIQAQLSQWLNFQVRDPRIGQCGQGNVLDLAGRPETVFVGSYRRWQAARLNSSLPARQAAAASFVVVLRSHGSVHVSSGAPQQTGDDDAAVVISISSCAPIE